MRLTEWFVDLAADLTTPEDVRDQIRDEYEMGEYEPRTWLERRWTRDIEPDRGDPWAG